MTTFDLIALLITILIVVMLLFFGVVWKLLDDIKAWQKSIWDELHSTYETPELQRVLSDLAINVKGNYNTLEQQQETIKYIRMRVNHILGLMHPAEEVIKLDAPTALDGLNNVQKDNANKSTNYNGYDPTNIVRGSETINKED